MSEGAFSITVPSGAKTLVITYVGRQTKELAIGNNASFTVSLEPVTSALNEVVVIGYGNAKEGKPYGCSNNGIFQRHRKNGKHHDRTGYTGTVRGCLCYTELPASRAEEFR